MTGGSAGPSTDRHNDPVHDPTSNVRELVEAERKRQDDLRTLDGRWRDRIAELRAEHDRDLRKAEAARIDAIRAVDVGNVQQAAAVAETRASTLANTVTATASAFDAKLITELDPLKKDIADLRRVQYEGVGSKTQVVESRAEVADFAPMVAAIEKLTAAQSQNVGAATQRVETRAQISTAQAVIGIIVAVVAAAGLYLGTHDTAPSPVVCTASYHPSPCP